MGIRSPRDGDFKFGFTSHERKLRDLGIVAADTGGGRDMGVVGSIAIMATVLPRQVSTCEVEQWVDIQCYIDWGGCSNVFSCQVCEK